MKNTFQAIKRPLFTAIAFVLATSGVVPSLLLGGTTYAAGQVSTRSIKLSDSGAGDTGVTYAVTFTPATNGTIGGLVVDFCTDSPIVGYTSCIAPVGMNLNASSPNTATNLTGTWNTTSSTATSFLYSNTASPPTVSSGTPVTLTLSNVTNPTSAGTFYARIATFDTAAHMTAQYPVSSTTRNALTAMPNMVDSGGIAMSISNQIKVTALVQEQLTFCVSGVSMSAGCSGMQPPNLTLGSGTPVVLGTILASAPAYTQTSTNASGGISVRMTNANSCGGLSRDSGVTCDIAPVGAAAAVISNSDAKFGMYVTPDSGNTTPTSPYDQGGSSKYAMDTGANGVTSEYGSQIFTSSGALADENDTLTFGADASNTTPAGIYTATMTLICTGTF